MADGRIDELRKRLEKEPGSRLFAQLAEELRKAGATEEAIQVAREGLQKHSAYHSARMTLARALMDTGDLASARPEFEAVLKGAPDNILASRLLGECLEGLGDLGGARARFKTTLAMAPGDKQVQAHLDAVEARLSGPTPPSAPPPSAPPAVLAAPPTPPTSPAPAADVEPPPIPLVAADEPFELEATYEAPATRVRETPVEPVAPPIPAPPPSGLAAAAREPEPEQEFVDFEAEARWETTAPIEIVSRVPLLDTDAQEPAAAPSPAPAATPELASPTLGELYFSQGHLDKAIDVFRQILDREPGNERASQRLGELRALQAAPAAAAASPAPGGRRAAIERTISRLEGMLSAVRRG